MTVVGGVDNNPLAAQDPAIHLNLSILSFYGFGSAKWMGMVFNDYIGLEQRAPISILDV